MLEMIQKWYWRNHRVIDDLRLIALILGISIGFCSVIYYLSASAEKEQKAEFMDLCLQNGYKEMQCELRYKELSISSTDDDFIYVAPPVINNF